jgi:hypothetical protein
MMQMIMIVAAVDTLMAMNLITLMYKLYHTMMGLVPVIAAVVNGKSTQTLLIVGTRLQRRVVMHNGGIYACVLVAVCIVYDTSLSRTKQSLAAI